MNRRNPCHDSPIPHGVTLVELVIVVAVMGIMLGIAVPGYRAHMMRVYRSEAVKILLQAALCQQRVHAAVGRYDTTRCLPGAESGRYRIVYEPAATQTDRFSAIAIPLGEQRGDRCGSLALDQNGTRGISAAGENTARCWNGR